MKYEVKEASPQAKAMIENEFDKIGTDAEMHHRVKYPFGLLRIGQCFTVAFADNIEISLRNQASAWAKKSGKKFVVIKHAKLDLIEAARIA